MTAIVNKKEPGIFPSVKTVAKGSVVSTGPRYQRTGVKLRLGIWWQTRMCRVQALTTEKTVIKTRLGYVENVSLPLLGIVSTERGSQRTDTQLAGLPLLKLLL